MDINEVLRQWFINLLIKKNSGATVKNENISNKELAEELNKPFVRKFNKRKVQSLFMDSIWGSDLADMQLISKFEKGIRFLLYVIDIYSKNAWVIPLKDQKGITITNAFQKILKESNSKPNTVCVDKGSKFYNRSMKSWLEKNDTKMYSTHNEGKSIIAEKFKRNLKNKVYKYMTLVTKNVYIDKLDDTVNKYLSKHY